MGQTVLESAAPSRRARVNALDAAAGFALAFYSLGYRFIAPLLAGRLDFPYAGAFENHAWMFIITVFWLLVLRRGFPVGTMRWRELREWTVPFATTMLVSLAALAWAYFSIKHTELRAMADLSLAAMLFQGTFSGLGEEFLFRGLVQSGLNNSLPMQIRLGTVNIGIGTILTAVFFGGLHLLNVWDGEPVAIAVVQASFGCLVGLSLGIGYERTNNLWGAVITHNVANVVNSVLLAII